MRRVSLDNDEHHGQLATEGSAHAAPIPRKLTVVPEARRRAHAYEPIGLAWLEEPLPAEDLGGHAELAAIAAKAIRKDSTDVVVEIQELNYL
jgi:hypothetical protein